MARFQNMLALLAVTAAVVSAQEAISAVQTLTNHTASDFVYVPSTTVTGAISTGADSVTSLRTATYWSALNGMGISQSAFTLAPCALRSPHIHQRGSGILYAHDVDSLEVGFVNENGTAVINRIGTGASAVFPQGLIHYQYNPSCTNASYTISYGSELPGTQVVTQALLALPAEAVAAALNLPVAQVALLTQQIPTNRFVGGVAECVARCGNSTSSTANAGRKMV